MPASWGPKRERQFKHIAAACMARPTRCKTKKCLAERKRTCRRIAGATVNKTRAAQCETVAGCTYPRR